MSFPIEPLTAPSNFELVPDKDVRPKSAEFQWDSVDTSPQAMRGEFKGYKVIYSLQYSDWKVLEIGFEKYQGSGWNFQIEETVIQREKLWKDWTRDLPHSKPALYH